MSWRDAFLSSAVRRLLALGLLCVLLIIGGRLFVRGPVTVEVVYELGRDARDVRGLTVTYRLVEQGAGPDGVIVLRKRINFPVGGAPENEAHRVRLARGSYGLVLEVERPTGTRTLERAVHIRGEGDVIRVLAQP
jgi:hypothetical protein